MPVIKFKKFYLILRGKIKTSPMLSGIVVSRLNHTENRRKNEMEFFLYCLHFHYYVDALQYASSYDRRIFISRKNLFLTKCLVLMLERVRLSLRRSFD